MANNKKQDHLFDTRHLNTDLKKRSLRGGAVTLGSQGLSFVIHIGSTMILARLLTPQDYGMISMVAAITGLAAIFSDLGLSTATIQQADINQKQVSNLFWINAGLGTIIALISVSISPVVAWFYKTPQLVWITAALSVNFFITGLATQHKALLNRQMRFYTIAKIQIFSTLLGIIVAIFMASHGLRYWALVLNTLVSSGSNCICTWVASGWRPSLPQRKTGVDSALNFGLNVAGFEIINYFSRNLDNVLIGRYYGSAAIGLYSKGYELLMLPIRNLRTPLNRVAIPALSRLQHDPESYRAYYNKFLSILSFISMPLVVFMFVCSDNLVRVILGHQWMGASEIFKILAFVALIQPVASTRGVVLLTTGNSKKYLKWGAGSACLSILSFICGLPWGGKGVASAYAIANYALLYPSLIYVFKGSPVCATDFFSSISKPLAASFIMGIVCFMIQSSIGGMGDLSVISISFIVSFPAYLLATVAVSGGFREIREYLSYGRLVFGKNN